MNIDPTDAVLVCLVCGRWQIDAPPRSRASFGLRGLAVAIAEAANDHHHAEHPDGVPMIHGHRLMLPSGEPATGGLCGFPLPRWWDWISVEGTR